MAMSKDNKMRLDMTSGNPYSLLLRFAFPLLAGNLLQQLYNVVDAIVVGQYVGEDALAAVGTSFPIMFLFVSLFAGISMGSAIVVAQYFGAKNYERLQHTVDTVYRAFIVSSLILSLAGYLIAEPMLRLINVPEEALIHAVPYLQIIFLGMTFVFGYNVNAGILQGMGDSKSLLMYLSVAVVSNIGLDLLFVAVFNMGTAGAALATVIAQCLAFSIGVLHINKKHALVKIRIRGGVMDWKILRDAVRLGVPAGLGNMSYSFGTMLLQNLVNSYGTAFMAGFAAASKIDAFAFLPMLTLGVAITTYVGQNVGAGKIDRVAMGVKSALVISAVTTLIMAPLSLIFGSSLIGLFNSNPEVVSAGMAYLTRMVPYIYLLAIMMILASTLRGAGQAVIPLFFQMLSLWVARVPLSYIFARYFGRDNMFYSFPIGWVLGLSVAIPYFLSGRWKRRIMTASGINAGYLTVTDEQDSEQRQEEGGTRIDHEV